MTLWQDWSPGKDAGCQKMGNTSDDEQRRSNKEMEANQGAGEVVQQVVQVIDVLLDGLLCVGGRRRVLVPAEKYKNK